MYKRQAQQDVPLGNGFCLIDPHGDLCEHILKYIPKERIEDLIYFDFANTDYPIGFNMFEADTEDEIDIVTNDITCLLYTSRCVEETGIQQYRRIQQHNL